MNVDQLKANLTQAICEGYGNYIVNFCDQDGDSITIDCVYLDDDGDVCLESNEVDNKDYTVQELIDILDRYRDSTTSMCTMMTMIWISTLMMKMKTMMRTMIIFGISRTIACTLIHTTMKVMMIK